MTTRIGLNYGDVGELVLQPRAKGGYQLDVYEEDAADDDGPLIAATLSHAQLMQLRDVPGGARRCGQGVAMNVICPHCHNDVKVTLVAPDASMSAAAEEPTPVASIPGNSNAVHLPGCGGQEYRVGLEWAGGDPWRFFCSKYCGRRGTGGATS